MPEDKNSQEYWDKRLAEEGLGIIEPGNTRAHISLDNSKYESPPLGGEVPGGYIYYQELYQYAQDMLKHETPYETMVVVAMAANLVPERQMCRVIDRSRATVTRKVAAARKAIHERQRL